LSKSDNPRVAFIEAAVWHGTLAKAEAMIAAHPELASCDIHTAALLGDDDAVRRFIALDPASATARSEPYGAEALVYLCLSKYLRLDSARTGGFLRAATALLDAGVAVNQRKGGDQMSVLLVATVNGQFDLASMLLDRGADPTLTAENGVAALYAAINLMWAPRAGYPQPRAHVNQKLSYLDLMKRLLEAGADPNQRVYKKVWYSNFNFDQSGVDEAGATAFWRAAYGADVDAMKLLVSYGADPTLPTLKPAQRPETGDAGRRESRDVSRLPPIPTGGPGVPPLAAAAGAGYGEGFAGNSHRHAPGGTLAAVRYLVEELGVDVNARDHEGNTAVHHAASRGDLEMIRFLVTKGADVKAVNREGQTTVDMANGPVQRVQPWPETIAFLESLGAKNNHKCMSC